MKLTDGMRTEGARQLTEAYAAKLATLDAQYHPSLIWGRLIEWMRVEAMVSREAAVWLARKTLKVELPIEDSLPRLRVSGDIDIMDLWPSVKAMLEAVEIQYQTAWSRKAGTAATLKLAYDAAVTKVWCIDNETPEMVATIAAYKTLPVPPPPIPPV